MINKIKLAKEKNMFRKRFVTMMVGMLSLILLSSSVIAKEIERVGSPYAKSSGVSSINPRFNLVNIGNWGYWLRDDAQSAHDPDANSGGIYPRGTAGAIYLDGLLWGGLLDGDLKVGGQTYDIGTQPGYISPAGLHVGPSSDSRVRIYRVRRDYKTLTYGQVRADAAEQNGVALGAVTDAMCQEIINNYVTDWEEWPADLGAPYEDVDEDGAYDPLVDVPGVASADQTMWFVVNDLNPGLTEELYATGPIGIEQQNTIWAYNQPGSALGQIVFKMYRMINKNSDGKDLTDVYVSVMSDPDLGDYGDDFVGCDTILKLGYGYNAYATDDIYDQFNLAPAAFGYDFFAGPIVESAGDTAIFDLKRRPGYKNLPMTSFTTYSASSTTYPQPPGGSILGAYAFYNLMGGYLPTTVYNDKSPMVDPITGDTTKYYCNGDPVAGTGWLDQNPGDRRMVLSSGPFTLAHGDTQDIVVAIVGGISDDNLKSVAAMKENDLIAQTLFDDLFSSVPRAPDAPVTVYSPNENYVVANWDVSDEAVKATEEFDFAGYAFQGYNLYQLPTAGSGKSEAVRIATFDIIDGVTTIYGNVFLPDFGERAEVPVQYGGDQGIQRYFKIEKDYLTGNRLIEGKEYYFAVTAYGYNEDPKLLEDKALESAVLPTPVVIQEAMPGYSYESDAGDAIEPVHSSGASNAQAVVYVVDPSEVTGHTYDISFHWNSDSSEILWAVRDSNMAVTVLDSQPQAANLTTTNAPVFDGVQARVSGPVNGIDYDYVGWPSWGSESLNNTYARGWGFDGPRWFSGDGTRGWSAFFGGLGMPAEFWGTSLSKGSDWVNVELRWAGCESCTDDDTTAALKAAKSMVDDPSRWQKAVVQYYLEGYDQAIIDIPFSAWDVSDPDSPRQLNIGLLDLNEGVLTDDGIMELGLGFPAASNGYIKDEYIFIQNTTYDPTYTDYLNWTYDATWYGPIMYQLRPRLYSGSSYTAGTSFVNAPFDFHIYATQPARVGVDEFTFTAPSVENTVALLQDAADRVNVFPNPYYGRNENADGRFEKFITFSHLPKVAEIKIFTIDGSHVVTLNKEDNGMQFLDWNLQNASGLPVASGAYIAHVDMSDNDVDLGTKVLKLFVVQSKQIVQYY